MRFKKAHVLHMFHFFLFTRLLRLGGRFVTRKPVNHTSSVTFVIPTDRRKSVCKHCVIEVFGGVFVSSIGFRIFCWYRGFCHRTESDLLIFLLASVVFITLFPMGWKFTLIMTFDLHLKSFNNNHIFVNVVVGAYIFVFLMKVPVRYCHSFGTPD